MERSRRWVLAERPTGIVEPKNFAWTEADVPELGDGQLLVRVLWLSCDPTQRGWLARDTYMPKVEIGEVVRSLGVGRVVASRHADFAEGDLVGGLVGWQDYAVLSGMGAAAPTKLSPTIPIELQMSTLGTTGQTAYFGLLDVGRPKPGETVVVSGAAGATGSIAAQIARVKGCRAIGIAGGPEKCAWLRDEAKLDGVVDYKSEDVAARLKELCPKGIDVFFDNVGGEQLDIALSQLAMFGRIVLCGAIAQYSDAKPPPGPRNYPVLIARRGRMEGFLVFDYAARADEAEKELAAWLAGGKLKDRVDVQHGLENAPATLRRLFTGENQGKQLLKIAD